MPWTQIGDFSIQQEPNQFSPTRSITFNATTKIKSVQFYASDMADQFYITCHNAEYTEELKKFLNEKKINFVNSSSNEIYLIEPNDQIFNTHLELLEQFDSHFSDIKSKLITAVCTSPPPASPALCYSKPLAKRARDTEPSTTDDPAKTLSDRAGRRLRAKRSSGQACKTSL
jgi:hypothetical protein